MTRTTATAVPMRSSTAGLESETWDVAVVGAGPAGAIAARRLALAGLRVVQLDRRAFPRDKACGDGLIPDAIACLRRNGLLDRVARLARRWPGGRFHGPYRATVDVDVELMTLRRKLLDAELAAAAAEAGATLARGLVTGVIDRRDAGAEVWVADAGAPIRARRALIATGASVALLDGCGLLEDAEPSAVAIRAYVESDLPLDRLVVSFDRRILPGYGWIFPMGDGTFNVGCGVVVRGGDARARHLAADLRGMLDRFCATFEPARALVGAERSREPVRGATLRYGLRGARGWAGGAVLAAGESVGSTYALTGEGIGKAMETAEMAADAIADSLASGHRDALRAYPERMARELGPKYRGYEFGERCARHAWLAELILRQAGRRARLRDALAAILAETRDPSEIFSFLGLARALIA